MTVHAVSEIRNVALLGHAGAGKTTLGEAILLKAGVTNRLGSVTDGTSVLDSDDESKDRKHSLDSAVFHIEWEGETLNFIDTPGMPDHAGPALASLSAVETGLIVISAVNGIGVNTRKMFQSAGQYGLARMIVITKFNAENADLTQLLEQIRENFGANCHPINLPAKGGADVVEVLATDDGESDLMDVREAHKEIIESVIETDDKLMEAYMAGGNIPVETLKPAVVNAMASGHIIPILFVDSHSGAGVADLLHEIAQFSPSALEGKTQTLIEKKADGEKVEKEVVPKADGPFVAQVFKVLSDPRSNIKYCVARVYSGSLKPDGNMIVGEERKPMRPGHIFKLTGTQTKEVEAAVAGDIVAFAKLDAHFGTTLHSDPDEHGHIPFPKMPQPMYALAIEPKSRADVEKIAAAMQRFADEDPCFKYHRDHETNELVMNGLGDQHLNVIQSKMKRYYKIEVDTKLPKIPYRETISASAKGVEYTHKKQTGGAGQFARVFIDMEPLPRGEGYEFADKIFGGAIDHSFRPSVDKGVRDQMVKGVIAGCPVVDVKVSLVDGKTHPVDSKDIAFQIAGRQVFKKAFMMCKPILLEPVVSIEVNAPAEYVGEITRDIAGKRGQILGQDVLPGNQLSIKATVPLGEVMGYASQLKSVTSGQGSYSMEFSHYDIVPPNVQQQITAAYKHVDEDED